MQRLQEEMNNMKKIFFIAILSQMILFAYGLDLNQNFFLSDEFGSLVIKDDSLIFDNRIEKGELKHNKYFDTFVSEQNTYILLDCKIDKVSFLTLVKKDTLSKEVFGLWYIPYVYCNLDNYDIMPQLVGFDVVSAKSYLVEKTSDGKIIEYLPKIFNMNYNPWAVSVKDENKKVLLQILERNNRGYSKSPINELIIVNGFVNPEKHYLYEQNSRAKKIRISYGSSNYEYELQDTGNYQVINLPQTLKENEQMGIEILDWYQGSKYSDIVISGIFYINSGYYN